MVRRDHVPAHVVLQGEHLLAEGARGLALVLTHVGDQVVAVDVSGAADGTGVPLAICNRLRDGDTAGF